MTQGAERATNERSPVPTSVSEQAQQYLAATSQFAGLEPPSDVHGSADYRRHLAAVCAVRAVAAARERGK